MKRIILFKEKNTKSGGKEIYVDRLSDALKIANIEHCKKHSIFPSFLPSWLRQVFFNIQICISKKNDFLLSFERIICPDIYRAGDGVHKFFLSLGHKSRLNPLHPILLFFEKICFKRSKAIIANSFLVKNQIIKFYDIPSEKIEVIYNGVDYQKIDKNSAYKIISKEYPIKDKYIFLFVGSGFKRKGLKEFIDLFSRINAKDCVAIVVGKDKKLNWYKEYAEKKSTSNEFFFTGLRDDVNNFYSVADFLILPTYYDPFSNTILEAMHFNNVVITTKQNGASEIINKNCVMKNPGDFSIVKNIEKLLKNKIEIESIKENNLIQSKKYSMERNVNETIKLISKCN